MDVHALGLAAAIVLLAATLQSAVGFGLGLVAVPLLVGTGSPLPDAVALALGAGFVQTAYGTYRLRREAQWRLNGWLAFTQCLTLPLGVALMMLLADARPARVKQAVGVMLLALLLTRSVMRATPRPRLAFGWGLLAGVTSGILSGVSGMGGPPLVLYALAHDWSKDRFRAFLWSQFLLVAPVLVALLAFRNGTPVVLHAAIGIALAPIVWLGARLGLSVTQTWNARQINIAAQALLYAIALSNLLAPLWAS